MGGCSARRKEEKRERKKKEKIANLAVALVR